MDKTKPILVRTPNPDFSKLSKLQKDRWDAAQLKRWIEGEGEEIDIEGVRIPSIPGSFIFGVDQCKLKHRQVPNGRPSIDFYEARDVGLLVQQRTRVAELKGVPHVVVKGRGSGFSTDGMGVMQPHRWVIKPGSTGLVTSKDKTGTSLLFSEKLEPMLQNCDKHIFNYEKYKQSDKNSGDVVKKAITATAIELKMRTHIEGYEAYNSLICRDTSSRDSSVSNFSGLGADFFFFDEFYLHQRPLKVINSIIPALSNPKTGKMEAVCLLGGVCEAEVSGQALADLKNLWDYGVASGWVMTFIPASMGKHCDENGWSDEPRYLEEYNKKMDTLISLGDTEAIRAYRKNNPMKLEDIWDMISAGEFEEDVIELVKHQITVVRENPPLIQKVSLMDYDGRIIKKANSKAPFDIIEEPRPGILYCATMDATATGSLTSQNEGSSASTFIIKLADPNGSSYTPVASYYERPKTVEESYQNTFKLIKYYNEFGGFQKLSAEANASSSEHLSRSMTKEGLQRFILMNKGKPFYYVEKLLRDTQIFRANVFLRKYISNINYLPLLEQMISGAELTKKDMLASWLMLFCFLKEDFDAPVRKVIAQQKEIIRWNPLTGKNERILVTLGEQKDLPTLIIREIIY